MHDVLYIRNDDREKYIATREKLASLHFDDPGREKVYVELTELENRQKRLIECNIAECTELRTIVYEKFDKLNKIGKFGAALQFKMMLVNIENRIQEIYTKELLDSMNKKADDKPSPDTKKQKTEKQKAASQNKWLINVDI